MMELFLKLLKSSWYGMAKEKFQEVKQQKHVQKAVAFLDDLSIQVKEPI